jgi:hypothetical protein
VGAGGGDEAADAGGEEVRVGAATAGVFACP